MGSLGTILRREREARGITLEEIAERTKIGIPLLRAIETEQFDKLPGGLFNKSFVRQYAGVLGVDEEIAVKEYLQAFGARKEAPVAARSRPPEPSFAMESESSRLILGVLGIGILAAGLAYGGYRLYGYLAAGPAPEEASGVTVLSAAEPAPSATVELPGPEDAYEPAAANDGAYEGSVEEPGSDTAAVAAALAEPESASEAGSAAVSLAPEDLALRIESHGTVWLSITADGVRQWQGTMRTNQSRDVQAAESVRLTVGDAGAVSLTLNGRALPGLGQPGEVRNLTITAKDAVETRP
jgi:cytoskeleton protein RodZ